MEKEGFAEVDRRYLRATYAEGVRHVDARLGELFDFLRERQTALV